MLQPLQSSNHNPEQIAIYNNTANAVVYTVPAGRKFIGRIGTFSSARNIFINSAQLGFFAGVGTSPANNLSLMDLTLIAGTVVSKENNTQDCFILGIEVDA